MIRPDRSLVRAAALSLAFVFAAGHAVAQNPLEHLLVPPELILRFADDLELDEQTCDQVRELAENARERREAGQQRVGELERDLQDLLAENELDENEITRAASALMEAEREVKLGQLRMHVQVQSLLSPLQRKLARARFQQMRSVRDQLPAKIQRVRRWAERLQRRGVRIEHIKERMREVETAVHEGDAPRAMGLVDRLLQRLEKEQR